MTLFFIVHHAILGTLNSFVYHLTSIGRVHSPVQRQSLTKSNVFERCVITQIGCGVFQCGEFTCARDPDSEVGYSCGCDAKPGYQPVSGMSPIIMVVR